MWILTNLTACRKNSKMRLIQAFILFIIGPIITVIGTVPAIILVALLFEFSNELKLVIGILHGLPLGLFLHKRFEKLIGLKEDK